MFDPILMGVVRLFVREQAYLFLAGLVATIVLQTATLNHALQLGDAMAVCPSARKASHSDR